MLARVTRGVVPPKRHSVLRRGAASLYYEHCLTRDGFAGPYTISYHEGRPQAFALTSSTRSWPPLEAAEGNRLCRRHLPGALVCPPGDSIDARSALLFNEHVVVSARSPTRSDSCYFQNSDADELLFVQHGKGKLISAFGALAFDEGSYLFVPKGVPHRFDIVGPQAWLSLEFRERLSVPRAFRNEVGQLTMDAPYGERDFSLPDFAGPVDEGIRNVLVKRDETLFSARYETTPLDMVGYDGSVYPFRFPIAAFQPRVSSVHLPPTAHGTFETGGVLVCSFVPRLLDFGTDAIPCPYPHSSVDIDEMLFYAAGDFTSRTGVGSGSITWHPRGTAHGPQPGRYEESIGKTSTNEVAVMLDCRKPLTLTRAGAALEDANYEASFR
jgi:homogentisate 1,2-dioxygenase